MLRKNKILLTLVGIITPLAALIILSACSNGGDTDGGKGNDTAAAGELYVSDGGAGATLTLEVDRDLAVAETKSFKVTARDPQGQPLEYIRIFCETEKGIAILEPSSGGVAFEHTSANGIMSGVIGGLVPGSYIMECRAPEGYGLRTRTSIIVSGPIPDGFVGFPGAAGGNLGGGLLVEDSEGEADTEEGLRISKVEFDDGDQRFQSGPIDIVRGICNNNTADDTSDDFDEPFFFNHFFITVTNDSNERVTIGTIGFTIQDGGPSATSTQSKTVVIEPGSSGEIEGVLTEVQASASKYFTGSSSRVSIGTYRVDLVVTGRGDESGSLSLARSVTLTFDSVNNCSAQ